MMLEIIGIGVDCIEISRFDSLNPAFFEKNYTTLERKYCNSRSFPNQHYAARLAAKEAIVKSFSNLSINLDIREIEISNNEDGSPSVTITDKYDSLFNIKLSLTHTENLAIAFVIVQGVD